MNTQKTQYTKEQIEELKRISEVLSNEFRIGQDRDIYTARRKEKRKVPKLSRKKNN